MPEQVLLFAPFCIDRVQAGGIPRGSRHSWKKPQSPFPIRSSRSTPLMGNSSLMEEGYGGGGGGSGSGAFWAPGSPRLSFSRDFVQSDVFTPSSARKDPASSIPSSSSSTDFDFGMLALLRAGAADGEQDVELIHNGKLLPIDRSAAGAPIRAASEAAPPDRPDSPRSSIGNDAEIAQIASAHESDQPQPPRHQVPPKSPASSSRWKDLLTLNFMRSSSSSSSPFSIETEPLNPSSSKLASSSSSSRLKLLFRSSSAGAGSRQHQQQLDDAQIEPSLGRSASESKVSTCCNNLRVADGDFVVRPRPPSNSTPLDSSRSIPASETGDDPKSSARMSRRRRNQSCSSSNPNPGHTSPAPTPRRKALAEVKSAGCSSSAMIRSSSSIAAPNYQRLAKQHANQSTTPQMLPTINKGGGKNSSMDAWRVYSERTSNASSGNGGGVVGTGSNNHGIKVAEVLHMEVCMGQSVVVSKVAKAFTKKENAPSKISVRT